MAPECQSQLKAPRSTLYPRFKESGIDQHVTPSVIVVFKEIFHPQLPLRMPCYDLVPVTKLKFVPTNVEASSPPGSLDLTGGEYRTRERIQRSELFCVY